MIRHLLLVEDDIITSSLVSNYLKTEGYAIHTASTMQRAREIAGNQCMDLIILDISLPDGYGFDLAKEFLHESGCPPMLFMSSHVGIEDVRKGFESGGQDYIKKPFSVEELGLRIRRILGDFNVASEPDRYIGNYRFNPTTHVLQNGHSRIVLGRLQAAVLSELSARIGVAVCKNDLLEKYWDGANYFTSRNLDSVIVKLRAHFKEDPSVRFIALKKEGYKLIIL